MGRRATLAGGTTQTLEGPSRRRDPLPLQLLLCLSVLFLTALVATAARVVVGGGAEGLLVSRTLVGPDGATLRFGDGGSVIIPPGALTRERRIVIRDHLLGAAGDIEGAGEASVAVYEIGPPDVEFLRPVTIVFPIPAGYGAAEVYTVVEGEPGLLRGELEVLGRRVVVRTMDLRFARVLSPRTEGARQGTEPAS